MAFQQQPQVRHFEQVFGRGRRHLEAALALGHHELFAGQPVENLPQGADAGAILAPERVQLELHPRPQGPRYDVIAYAPECQLAYAFLDDLPVVCHIRLHGAGLAAGGHNVKDSDIYRIK